VSWAAFTHSWIPVIIGASAIGLVLFFLLVLVLIPICRGFYPCVESKDFKFRFEKGVGDNGQGMKP